MRLLACTVLVVGLVGCKADNFGDDLPESTTYNCADCGKSMMAKTGDPAPVCHNRTMNPSTTGAAAELQYTCATCGATKPLTDSGAVPECHGARMTRQ